VNEVLPLSYAESVRRLALGLEPLDALRGGRVGHPVRVDLAGDPDFEPRGSREPYRHAVPAGGPRPALSRHDSCLHALLYHPALAGQAEFVVYDHGRRYVPRRLRVPLAPAGEADARPAGHRVRRPALFPGAAYDADATATGLRGRVLRSGAPMAWARVEARMPASNALVGRAHGDDRGEFLLLLWPGAAPFGDSADPLEVRVVVYGPAVASPIASVPPGKVSFASLPVEEVPVPGQADPVSTGEALPTGYAAPLSATRVLPFRLGRILAGAEVAPFEFLL
jgi:hypothetical protein